MSPALPPNDVLSGPATLMLPPVPVVKLRLPTVDALRLTEPALLMTALPPVLAERLTALMRIGVALVPMLPLVLIRLTVGLVGVEFPDRVMAPLPSGVRLIV